MPLSGRPVRWPGWRGACAAAALLLGAQPLSAVPVSAPASASVAAQRIVSLVPALTESVCALGACERLVGTDRHSNWPERVQRLPKLGGIDDAQVEAIVALRPDLVLASASARVTARLRALGLDVLVLDVRDQAGLKLSLARLAERLGVPAEADRVWAAIERDVDAAAARIPSALRGQRIYFEVDPAPYAAGAPSFIGQLFERLGLANAVPAALGAFPKLNPEFVVRLDPDIVMAERRALVAMRARPGWQALRALREHRTCGFASAPYDVLVRPGPRLGEAARLLVDCLTALPAVDRRAGPRP